MAKEAAEGQEAKESVLGAVKAHQSVQVTEYEIPEALQAAAEAVEVAEAQQARIEDQQDPPPRTRLLGILRGRDRVRVWRCRSAEWVYCWSVCLHHISASVALSGPQWPPVALSGPNGLGLGLGATHFNGTSYLDLPLSCYVPFILCSSFILPFVAVPLLFLCALT